MATPPELMDELVEEILLRFPPHDPACLIRTALVCKRWRRLVSDPGFSHRFCKFHRMPPMLGFLCNLRGGYLMQSSRFVPTISSSCSSHASGADDHWRVDDARHGRVLLSRLRRGHVVLMVWDPITNQRQELPILQQRPQYNNWRAAIVCAGVATGTCDHLDCRCGPFLVVYMGSGSNDIFTCIYSSNAAAWNEPVSTDLPHHFYRKSLVQSVLVGKSLYFMFQWSYEVLEYDLELCKVVSVIELPLYSNWRRLALITTEDGELGYATVIEYKLNLWSWKKADSKGDAGWLQSRVIDLDGPLHISDRTTFPQVVGFADGAGVIFLKMKDVFFTIDLKTYKTKEVYNDEDIYIIVPYMSFCTPGPRIRRARRRSWSTTPSREILLRLPPDEPRCLFRASLVCKPWRRLLTDAAFLRRYRRFHRAPPLLGFFFINDERHNNPSSCFIPTTSPFLFPRTLLNYRPGYALDCRHGRVLFRRGSNYVVWDTIADELVEELPEPARQFRHISEAVLCAVAGCDHSDCHGGPFLVVRVTKDDSFSKGYARVYSSCVGSWGSCASVVLGLADPINLSRATVVGDEVYFMLQMGARILKYDIAKHHLSVIDPPEWYYEGISLMPTVDGLLGVTVIRDSNLHLWSRKVNSEGVEAWIQCRVIELWTLLPPVDTLFKNASVIGFVEGVHAIIMSTDVGVFIIDPKSRRARNVSGPGIYRDVVPFMSFYTLGLYQLITADL